MKVKTLCQGTWCGRSGKVVWEEREGGVGERESGVGGEGTWCEEEL